MVKPEAEKDDSKASKSDYTPGEIIEDKNAYQNQQFGIQILGQDMFTFDSSKTDELKTVIRILEANIRKKPMRAETG